MEMFDSAIFDPDIFDCGEAAVVGAGGSKKKKQKKRYDEEEELMIAQFLIKFMDGR